MTTIGASLVITGQVTSQEDITIHGRVHGQISMTEGTLLIAPSATVEADAQVPRVTVHGRLSGDVNAAESVELAPTAAVEGKLVAPAVILRDGALFNGVIEVTPKARAAAPKLAKSA